LDSRRPASRQIIPVAVHGRGTGIIRLPAGKIRTRTDSPPTGGATRVSASMEMAGELAVLR
jgi:hypothetical protein